MHYASHLYAPENEYLYMNIYTALMNKYFFQKPIDKIRRHYLDSKYTKMI